MSEEYDTSELNDSLAAIMKKVGERVAQQIEHRTALVEGLIAHYMRETGRTIDDLTLVEDNSDPMRPNWYVASRTNEPWKSLRTYEAENAALKELLERAQGILSSLILHDGVDEEEANKLWDEINAVIPSEEVKF